MMISDVYFPRVNGVSTSISTFRRDLELLGCDSMLLAPRYPKERDDGLHHYAPWLPKSALQKSARFLSRAQCNSVDRVIAPSDAMAHGLRAYRIRKPIDVVPTGLDLRDFAGGDGLRFRALHGIAPTRPVMLHVGRVAHEKNIGFIVDVVGTIRLAVPDVLLIIAGEGPATRSLRRQAAERGLNDHVLFLGYLDRSAALLDCYRGADVLVFASSTETQGLVPLEAMAVGTPVVSTAVLGTAAIVGPGRGALAVPEDIDAFAQAVIDVLRSLPLREALSREARAYVAECWSSYAMAGRLVAVYEQLAAMRTEVSCRAATRQPDGERPGPAWNSAAKRRNDG
jgi:1,2-diacylglycerol 3-alpha-glucosyltransferase